MWCPQCRSEYKEGITECVDCHIALVPYEELPEENKNNESFDADFVEWAGNHPEEIEALRKREEMENALNEHMERVMNETDSKEEFMEQMASLAENAQPVKAFVSSLDRAEEYKTSGYTLMLVGGVGLIALALLIAGVLPLRIAGSTKFLSYGVMGTLFVIFLVTGIKALMDSKKLQEKGHMEQALETELKEWFIEAFPAADIDADCCHTEKAALLPDEEKYYKRSENIREKILAKYNDIDEAFLDKITEDLYQDIFDQL